MFDPNIEDDEIDHELFTPPVKKEPEYLTALKDEANNITE